MNDYLFFLSIDGFIFNWFYGRVGIDIIGRMSGTLRREIHPMRCSSVPTSFELQHQFSSSSFLGKIHQKIRRSISSVLSWLHLECLSAVLESSYTLTIYLQNNSIRRFPSKHNILFRRFFLHGVFVVGLEIITCSRPGSCGIPHSNRRWILDCTTILDCIFDIKIFV